MCLYDRRSGNSKETSTLAVGDSGVVCMSVIMVTFYWHHTVVYIYSRTLII